MPPWAKIVLEAPNIETIVVTEVDLEILRRNRKNGTVAT
jgi:hypothetical protein